MNINTAKIEITKMILETDNPEILGSIKSILDNSRNKDFWDELTPQQKHEIDQGIMEVENGEIMDYEEVMKKHR